MSQAASRNAGERSTSGMSDVTIEEVGGFVGAGTPGGHIHMRGTVTWSSLSEGDRAAVDRLFAAKTPVNANHYYRLTRTGPKGAETIDAADGTVPAALLASVRTTLD